MRKRSQAIIAAHARAGNGRRHVRLRRPAADPESHHPAGCAELERQQEQKVRTRILKTLDQCNQNRDTDTLPTILEGPELDIRTSVLNVAKTTAILTVRPPSPRIWPRP